MAYPGGYGGLEVLFQQARAETDGSPLKLLRLFEQMLRTCGADMQAESREERQQLLCVSELLIELCPAGSEQLSDRLNTLSDYLVHMELTEDACIPPPDWNNMPGGHTEPADQAHIAELERENQHLREKNDELTQLLRIRQSEESQEAIISRLQQRIHRQTERIRELERVLADCTVVDVPDELPQDPTVSRKVSPAPKMVLPNQIHTVDLSKNVRIPADAEHLCIVGGREVPKHRIRGLSGLKTVEFSGEVQILHEKALYGCAPVHLYFQSPNCSIHDDALFDTEILSIHAPAGGSVQDYAQRRQCQFEKYTGVR